MKFLIGAIDILTFSFFLLLLLYGGYKLYQDTNVYSQADPSKYAMYRPTKEDETPFAKLQEQNSDVIAWLTIDGTNINYPVLKGDKDNSYLNTDPFGNYSISGSIYLEYGQPTDFSGFNSTIYGHHMQQKKMFGELREYIDPEYLEKHKHGNLHFNGQDHDLRLFAFIEANAYDSSIYRIKVEPDQEEAYLANLLAKSTHNQDVTVTANDRIVLLSTCASINTYERHIVVGLVSDEARTVDDTKSQESDTIDGITQSSSLLDSCLAKLAVIFILIVLFILIILRVKKRRKNSKNSTKK